MNTNTLIVLAVSCSVFLIILSLIICYYFMSQKQTATVSPNLAYQIVEGDSSVNCVLDSITPSIFHTSNAISEPCCICFDKYCTYRIPFGCFIRILHCSHIFHSQCIEDWVTEKKITSCCPLCKKSIFS